MFCVFLYFILFYFILLQGIVSLWENAHQMILQGVHELYDLEETPQVWSESEPRGSRLIFIGGHRCSTSAI